MKINLHNLAASIRTLLGNVQAHLTKPASATELGHVKVGENLTIDSEGKLSASAPDIEVPIATSSAPGLVKPNGTTITVDSAGTLQIPTALDTRYGVTLLYNGVTSNALDKAATANSVKMVNDKIPVTETGTWTPKIAMGDDNGTYSKRIGTYVRQGNVVHAYFAVTVTKAPTGTGSYFAVGGLPFTASSANYGLLYPFTLSYMKNVKYGSSRIPAVALSASSSQGAFYFYDVITGVANTKLASDALLSEAEIAGSITYVID